MAKKEESKKEPTEEYAGLGKEVFVFKKEDFDNPSLWHKISIVDDSTVSDFGNWIVGEEVSEEKPRSFIVPLTLVDEEEAHYEAQMLARTVLPVFSKSMMPVTLPDTPFQLRDSYTKLYRNPHNFFYSAMGNIYSSFFRKKSEEEQLFEKLETALNLGNLRSIRFRSQLFHHWLKSK
jgi:hypothetical protein|nr:MAG TPA: hypothetical protein [Caudoviricetes sp.]